MPQICEKKLGCIACLIYICVGKKFDNFPNMLSKDVTIPKPIKILGGGEGGGSGLLTQRFQITTPGKRKIHRRPMAQSRQNQHSPFQLMKSFPIKLRTFPIRERSRNSSSRERLCRSRMSVYSLSSLTR